MPEQRQCNSCKGVGHTEFYPNEPCFVCKGSGTMPEPDVPAILAAIKGRKGLRTAKPKNDNRAYYVWRMARFHGGVDVTMPIWAETLIHGDPWVKELAALADAVAKHYFGTHMAAATRWAGILGGSELQNKMLETLPNLPSTAQPCGPVVTEEKPVEELPEMF